MTRKTSVEETKKIYDALMSDEDHYKIKSGWHSWEGSFHRYRCNLLRDVFREVGTNEKTQILDVGSGLSLLGELFEPEECPQVTAIDISKYNIERGSKLYPHIHFQIDDVQDPSIKGQWDILFAGEIIEHVEIPRLALEKWTALLREGGHLIMTTPNALVSMPTAEHISLMKTWQVRDLLDGLGYEEVKVIGIDLFVPLACRLSRVVKGIPKFWDAFFQKTMRMPYHYPNLARDVVYVFKRKVS
jgi:2-polyprenyl-3-methyl-5-hydroxy-6-metoxy-1,4-benzoquinol methylase